MPAYVAPHSMNLRHMLPFKELTTSSRKVLEEPFQESPSKQVRNVAGFNLR